MIKKISDIKVDKLLPLLDYIENNDVFTPTTGILSQCHKFDIVRGGQLCNSSETVQSAVAYVLNTFRSKFGDGYCPLMITLTIDPEKSIPTHCDQGEINRIAKRYHIPLKTNKNAYTYMNDIDYHLEVGNIYQLNTFDNPHGAYNKGEESRTHLIVDWILE